MRAALATRIEKLEAVAASGKAKVSVVFLHDWTGETEDQALERTRAEGNPLDGKIIVFIRKFSPSAIR